MLTNKKLQKAYNKLVSELGPEDAPNEFKKSIFIIQFQLFSISAVSDEPISRQTVDSMYDLFLLYLFFDEMEMSE